MIFFCIYKCAYTHVLNPALNLVITVAPKFNRVGLDLELLYLKSETVFLGSFVVRKSKQEGALALSVMTHKLGVQHLLITCQRARWMLTGEKNVVREFKNVPELISYYRNEPLPVKGIKPFLLR